MYDYGLPDEFRADNPYVAQAVKKLHVKSAPWNHTAVLTSRGGQQFTSFAKFTDYDAGKPKELVKIQKNGLVDRYFSLEMVYV